MRIIYLHQYFNTPAMSGGTRSYEMAKRFVGAGHEVHMVTTKRELDGGKGGWQKYDVDGISVHSLGVPYSNEMGFAARLNAFAKFAMAAGPKAREIGGDVVFATSTPLTIALPGVYAARRLRSAMVFEVRDLWPEVPIALGALRGRIPIAAARRLERFAYRNSAQVVALSPGMADGVAKTGYPRERITVVPNSSDLALFARSRESGFAFLDRNPHLRGGQLVVYTGTLGRVNGVGYMVDIAREMLDRNPSVKFLIVGDGAERNLILSKADDSGVLGVNLWHMDQLPKKDIPGVFGAASISASFVVDVPELWNNSANKFFDSMAAGTPILINHGGWQAEILQRSGAGLVVPPDDAHAAARQLADFLADPSRVAEAGHAATRLAVEDFDREILAARLLDVLTRATSS
jgi:glycosyltransferase involved in cell wall biosynthesis